LKNALEIAEHVADSIVSLYNANYTKFHLVGFSLGAQIVGEVGRKVISKTSGTFKIPRITGLDPAYLFNLSFMQRS
jgi:surfactin synthase thioesterase subunit